jgi:hypothetical protein
MKMETRIELNAASLKALVHSGILSVYGMSGVEAMIEDALLIPHLMVIKASNGLSYDLRITEHGYVLVTE